MASDDALFQTITILVGIAVVGFGHASIGGLATTLYLHKDLTHRSLTLKGPARWLARFIVWVAGVIDVEWATTHRGHHQFTDRVGLDPHTPLEFGGGMQGASVVFRRNFLLYRRWAKCHELISLYMTDYKSDRWTPLFNKGVVGPAVVMPIIHFVIHLTMLSWLMDWRLLTNVAVAVVMTATTTGIAIIGYLVAGGWINSAHRANVPDPDPKIMYTQNLVYKNRFKSFMVKLLSWGEYLHLNHHKDETRANFAFKKGEWDPGYWVFCVLRWFGMAEVNKTPPPSLPDEQAVIDALRRSSTMPVPVAA
jgi:stearoyl-CoA desaturase (delta-9 desaturase)